MSYMLPEYQALYCILMQQYASQLFLLKEQQHSLWPIVIKKKNNDHNYFHWDKCTIA